MLSWCTEHSNSVINCTPIINDNAINRLPQIVCNGLLNEFPTVTETRKAIQHLSSDKASAGAIPAEIFKAGGLPMALTELFYCMCMKEAIQQEFKDAFIIQLYKRKENLHVCDNRRGILYINCWKDTGKQSIISPECASSPGLTYTRKSA